MIDVSKSEVAAALERLKNRGLNDEHFVRLHHREQVTLATHLDYLRSTSTYRKQTQANIGRRILWLDQNSAETDWHTLIDEALHRYPM